jgi:hypothetical protein
MSVNAYAAGTSVSVENSKAELDRILGKHGATQRGVMADDVRGLAAIMFVLSDRSYRVEIPLPKIIDEFTPKSSTTTPRDWWKWGAERRAEWTREKFRFERRSRTVPLRGSSSVPARSARG